MSDFKGADAEYVEQLEQAAAQWKSRAESALAIIAAAVRALPTHVCDDDGANPAQAYVALADVEALLRWGPYPVYALAPGTLKSIAASVLAEQPDPAEWR